MYSTQSQASEITWNGGPVDRFVVTNSARAFSELRRLRGALATELHRLAVVMHLVARADEGVVEENDLPLDPLAAGRPNTELLDKALTAAKKIPGLRLVTAQFVFIST